MSSSSSQAEGEGDDSALLWPGMSQIFIPITNRTIQPQIQQQQFHSTANTAVLTTPSIPGSCQQPRLRKSSDWNMSVSY